MLWVAVVRLVWDMFDWDNLNFHYQYAPSFAKCFSVVKELLKCEPYACDSAISCLIDACTVTVEEGWKECAEVQLPSLLPTGCGMFTFA